VGRWTGKQSVRQTMRGEEENRHYLVERRSPCLAAVVVASFANAV